MALNTYEGLLDEIREYLQREGFHQISDRAPQFLDMGQRRVNRRIRVPAMEALHDLTVDTNGKALLPPSFTDLKYIVVTNATCAWTLSRAIYPTVISKQLSETGAPRLFDIEAGSIFIGPKPRSGEKVTIVYYKELPFISSTNDTNWFNLNAPELLLFAALVEAALFMKDADLAQIYELKYTQAVKELESQRDTSEHSGSPLSVKLVG